MKIMVWMMISLLCACSPVKLPVSNQYKLNDFYFHHRQGSPRSVSIFVAQPDAMGGYQTEQMLYTDKLFAVNAFAHNAWISSPANMLLPLITQSLQQSHYFSAVASGPEVEKTDYRLETQVIVMEQNFLTKPSAFDLVVQAVLTRVDDNHVLASRVFKQHVICPSDTPYGGVIAANRATYALTKSITEFVVKKVGA